jgi:hypothetical protein
MDNSRILVIPDLHFPYCHVDALDFLHKLKVKLQPTRVICLGDELDFHAMSFHDSDPDLDSAGRELVLGLGYIDTLHELFPKLELLHSNHGSMFYRKAKHHGMPRHLLRSYNDSLGVGNDWSWHESIILELPNGNRCKFIHGASANVLAASQQIGMSLVQGHHHSLFELRYWTAGNGLHFAITSGCLIDDTSLAFAYNKLQVKRPIVGVTFIENSLPYLIPMSLDSNNRWTGTKI